MKNYKYIYDTIKKINILIGTGQQALPQTTLLGCSEAQTKLVQFPKWWICSCSSLQNRVNKIWSVASNKLIPCVSKKKQKKKQATILSLSSQHAMIRDTCTCTCRREIIALIHYVHVHLHVKEKNLMKFLEGNHNTEFEGKDNINLLRNKV